ADMLFIETRKRIEDINVVGNEYGRRVLRAEGRHLLQDIHKFGRNGIEKDLRVNVDHRYKHLGGNIGSDNLFEFLSKCSQIIRIEGQPRCILMTSELFQQVAARADGAVQVKTMYT